MKTLPVLTLLLFSSFALPAQVGPGGVGNSTNNVFWLKADKGTSSTTNGTAISFWNDQSGNGLSVTQSVANQQPLYATNVINGFPAVQFDNVNGGNLNDKMIGTDSPLLDNTNGYSFFTVTRPQNLGDARVIVSKRTTVSVDQSFMLFYYSGNNMYVDIQTTNDRFSSSSAFSTNTNYIIDLFYDGTIANPRCSLYVGETFNIASNETSTLVPDNASPIILGTTDATDPRPYGGYMSEIIIYREALVSAQRIIVNNYLSAKYDIALSANDKYAGDNNGNGDYDFDAAGVGQESTGSNTSFWPSACAGLGITATAGLNNGDYIMAGHAVATNTVNTTDVGGMTGVNNARWLRIWYIDITNTSTAISTNIEFDATDGGAGTVPFGNTVSDYVLLYRAGQTGNWTELATASSVSGDRISFNGITLSADGYYTLGSKNVAASVLPIELVEFNAAKNGSHVDLTWVTASEKNNAYFTVEKSKDGLSFEKVAQVPGAGTSSARLSYKATDASPYKGLSYYRLKQTDHTSGSSYSPLAVVDFNAPAGAFVTVFPNPSEGIIYLSLQGGSDQDLAAVLSDESGRICLSRTWKAGSYGSTVALDTENKLSKGSYVISVTSGSRNFSQKIIIR